MRIGGDARRGAPGQHAGGDHGAAGSRARPQVVGDLPGTDSQTSVMTLNWSHLKTQQEMRFQQLGVSK